LSLKFTALTVLKPLKSALFWSTRAGSAFEKKEYRSLMRSPVPGLKNRIMNKLADNKKSTGMQKTLDHDYSILLIE